MLNLVLILSAIRQQTVQASFRFFGDLMYTLTVDGNMPGNYVLIKVDNLREGRSKMTHLSFGDTRRGRSCKADNIWCFSNL